MAYESILSLAQRLRLRCRDAAMLSKTMKKCISTPNFETFSHQNVTPNKSIGIVYFMYIDMAWFSSLSRLEHNMLYLTVWPLHTLLELLLNIKGPLTWIISKVNSIPMPCSMAYESILSLAQHLRLLCRMMRRYQKHSKKSISTSNFKNLVLIIVLANIWRCNMYVILS